MSHTVAQDAKANVRWFTLTVMNYTAGGETLALSDVFASVFNGAIFGTVDAGNNSLGVPLFPILSGATLKLFRFVSGAPAEIPTTTALNAVISVLVNIEN